MEFLTEIRGLDFISELFIKSSIILTFTLILLYLFRKKSASIKHFLLSVSLILLLLIPFLSSLTEGWETGLLPTWQTGDNRSQIALPWDKLGKSTIFSNSITPLPADQQLLTQVSEDNSRSNFFLSKYSISKGIFGLILVAIWSAGLLILLSRIFLGLIGAQRLTRQGQIISGSSWWQLLNHFLNEISIKRKINLFSHKKVSVPLTWGVIKPVVILPSESKNWTQDQRSSALFHELSHIKRGDFLLKILARCSVALYWFNPLSWFAFKMMKKEQEKACDELVLKTGVKPSTYAVNLLSIKKSGQIQWNSPSTALGAVGKSQLNERLIAILKQQRKPKETNMKTKIMLSSLIILTIAFIGLARPSQSEAFTDNVILPEEAVFPDIQDVKQETTVQEKQVKKTTKKTTKEEPEENVKKTITWVSEDGEKIEFIISEDEEGLIKVSNDDGKMQILIDKDSTEKKFSLLIGDKYLVLQKDEEGNWSIQEGDKDAVNFHLCTSQKSDMKNYVVYEMKGDKNYKSYNIVYRKKGDKEGKNVFHVKAPKIHIEKHEKTHGSVDIHVAPKIAIPNKKFNIHIEGEEGGKNWVYVSPEMKLYGTPYWTKYSLHDSGIEQKELKEKLAEITKRLKEIREEIDLEQSKESQEEALKEVEEMVKKLSKKLKEKAVELKDISLSLHSDVKDIHLDEDENVIVDIKIIEDFNWVEKKDVDIDRTVEFKEGKNIAFVTTDEGGFQINMKSHFDSKNKSKYEDIVNKLRKDLPKGYTVESVIDEEGESITIKISGVKEDKKAEKKIKEILEDLEKQISSIK